MRKWDEKGVCAIGATNRAADARPTSQIDSLRSDNVKLYEKIKYMQSYSGPRTAVPADDVVERYERRRDSFPCVDVVGSIPCSAITQILV